MDRSSILRTSTKDNRVGKLRVYPWLAVVLAQDIMSCRRIIVSDKEEGRFRAFSEPLQEGVILARPNRFIMDVELDGQKLRCHCPVVSRIGGLDLAGRPCLVSDSHNPKRKFAHSVEAFSLARPDDNPKSWIGINQNASNRHVEYFLAHGAFDEVTGPVQTLRREVPLGDSRLDFLVNDELYLEVKTPLVQIQTEVPDYVPRLPDAPFNSTDRAMRHLRELAASLESHERAIVLYCLYYDNFGFRYYHGTTYDEVMSTVDACSKAGVELWQADFEVTPAGVRLKGAHPMEEW